MRLSRFWITYLILAVAQIFLQDYLHLSQFLSIWFLPMMVLCIPIRNSVPVTLVITFVTAIFVDILSQGVLGLSTVALLPVALCRNVIISLVFGEEVFSRGEDISIRRQGVPKMTLAVVIATALFLLVYIWADGAGTRPFWFNFTRFTLSLIFNSLLSMFLVNTLSPEEAGRWR